MKSVIRVVQGAALALAFVALAVPFGGAPAIAEPTTTPATVAVAPTIENGSVVRSNGTVTMANWQETFIKRRPTTFVP